MGRGCCWGREGREGRGGGLEGRGIGDVISLFGRFRMWVSVLFPVLGVLSKKVDGVRFLLCLAAQSDCYEETGVFY